jgi:PAS domain S-box-containing protein
MATVPRAGAPSPWRLVAVALGVLFVAEVVVMHALPRLGLDLEEHATLAALLNASLLALLCAPLLWAVWGRPLRRMALDARARADAVTTERRLAEEARQRSEANFRTLIERSPDVVVVHRGGNVVYVNPAALALLGYEPAELVGHSVLGLVHPDDRELVVRRMRAARGAATALEPAEERYVRKDGSVLVLEVVALPVTFGESEAVLAIARDLTERKQLQARLVASDRLASIGTLAAGIAHEINNPLTYVIANLGVIAEELPTLAADIRACAEGGRLGCAANDRLADIEGALSDARDGATRVRQIVRDLKTFSRFQEEAAGPTDVHAVIESAINMAWTEICHRARLVKDYGSPPLVDANTGRLGQVLINLLVNAAQAMPERPLAENVIRVVTARDDAGRAVIEVQDNGAGIAPEQRSRIFEPFFTTKPAGVGTGLGLAICREIVTGLEGRIELESDVGKGSTFRVTLPAAQLEPATPKPPASVVPPSGRARVLVVDDEPAIGAMIRRALGAEAEVTVLTQAAGAAAEILGARWDVILCDLMMPDTTGMDLYEAVSRERPEVAERMVFMSGGAFTARARAFLDRVPNARVEKPFEPRDLRALVRDRMLGARPARSAAGEAPSSDSAAAREAGRREPVGA